MPILRSLHRANSQMVLPTDLITNTVRNIAVAHDFKTYKIFVTHGSNHGENFVGIIYQVVIKGVKDNGKVQEFQLIVKAAPLTHARRENFNAMKQFKREIYVYETIIPHFLEIQTEKAITNGFTSYAICFKTLLNEFNECVILNDLKQAGYFLEDKSVPCDLKRAKLVVESLAKFHAFSFVLKVQDPEKLKELSINLPEVMFTNPLPDQFREMYGMHIQRAIDILKPDDKIEIEKMEKFKGVWSEKLSDCVNGKLAEPYAAVIHGDAWKNNFMFKYNQNAEPISVCLLDWQLTRYASPVIDLCHFIFLNTDKNLRDKHYHSILLHYHNTLRHFLNQFGCDINTLFPYTVFEQHLKRFGIFGLIMGVMMISMITSNVEDVPDLDQIHEKLQNGLNITEIKLNSNKTQPIYEERMRDVIKDIVKLNYL